MRAWTDRLTLIGPVWPGLMTLPPCAECGEITSFTGVDSRESKVPSLPPVGLKLMIRDQESKSLTTRPSVISMQACYKYCHVHIHV